MVTQLGTILGTHLGTNLSTQAEVWPVPPMYVLSTSGGSYQTAVDGGEAGVATGFGVVVLAQLVALPSISATPLAGRGASAGTDGYRFLATSSSALQPRAASGAGALVTHNSRVFIGSDVGKIFGLVMRHTGSAILATMAGEVLGYTPTAITGYTPNAGLPHLFGTHSQFRYLAHLAFRGTPSDADLQAMFSAARSMLGDLPTSVANGTVTHHWSLKRALAGQSVTDGQAGPASLPDTITGAAIDRMDRVSSPVVQAIDTTVDGRKTYGVITPVLSTALVGANGLGLQGSVGGFWGALLWRYDRIGGTSSQSVVNLSWASGNNWALQIISSALRLGMRTTDGGFTFAVSPTVALVSADIGVTEPLLWNFDGTNFRLYRRGAMIAEVAGLVGGYVPNTPGNVAMGVGNGPTLTQPLDSASLFRLLGHNSQSLSAGQIAEVFATFASTGRLVAPTGAPAEHEWDLTQDVIANGGPDAGFPAIVRDRVGTDHLTRMGTLVVDHGGAQGFTAQYYRTAAAGGLPGATTGFWAEAVWYHQGTFPTVAEALFAVATNSLGTGGYALKHNAVNVLAYFRASGAVQTLAYSAASLTVGFHHLLLRFDGGQGFLYVDGVQRASTATGLTYELPTGIAPTIGVSSNQIDWAATRPLMGASGGNYLIDDTEIAAAAAAGIAAGKPVGIPGKTDRLWSIPDDVTSAGGKVPAIVQERIAGLDKMVLIGAPLQVAQRVERLWGWEAA